MEGYTVTITEGSREFTAREKIMLKDTGNAVALDEATRDNKLIITPVDWAKVEIHNEKNTKGDKDYSKFVVIDKDGTKYTTGSSSFISSFLDIWADMIAEGEEFEIEVYQTPSKNYSGKNFLSCSLI